MDKTQIKEKLVVMKVEVDNIGSITECSILTVLILAIMHAETNKTDVIVVIIDNVIMCLASISLVFCVAFLSSLYVWCPLLFVYLDCSFKIVASFFSNVY